LEISFNPNEHIIDSMTYSNGNLYILGAGYGLGEVTQRCRELLTENQTLDVTATNGMLRDLWYGTAKSLAVVYQRGSASPQVIVTSEGKAIRLSGKPPKVVGAQLVDVSYLLEKRELNDSNSKMLTKVTYPNKSSLVQTVRHKQSFEMKESNYWVLKNSEALGVYGLALNVSARKPVVTPWAAEMGALFDKIKQTKEEGHFETVVKNVDCSINIPAMKSIEFSVVAKEFRCSIPFTGILIKSFETGEVENCSVEGIYHGLRVGGVYPEFVDKQLEF